jgi:hypothetical protein
MSGLASITLRKVSVNDPDVQWSFSDGAPIWCPSSGRFHWGREVLDPFPAYPHEIGTAEEAVEEVRGALAATGWTPPWTVDVFLLDREAVSRSNGWSSIAHADYDSEAGKWLSRRGFIAMSGKRTPPHPAVTRYLVGHEYGHNVEDMLTHQLGLEEEHPDELIRRYAKVREWRWSVHRGSGGRWHSAISEVFACDFRIQVCGIDPDFWPHPGVQHPYELEQVQWWWKEHLGGGE